MESTMDSFFCDSAVSKMCKSHNTKEQHVKQNTWL